MMSEPKHLQDHPLFKTGYLINGEWRQAQHTFEVLNPANGQRVASVAKCGQAETEAAIDAAYAAFPSWRDQTAKQRSEILYRWYQLMMDNQQYLAELMTAEQGKPLGEAKGEVAYAASFIQWFAEQAKRVNGEII